MSQFCERTTATDTSGAHYSANALVDQSFGTGVSGGLGRCGGDGVPYMYERMISLATNVIHARMQDYTPFSPEVLAEPSAAYPYLLNEAPVHRCESFDPPFYTLSRYADVAAAPRDVEPSSRGWMKEPSHVAEPCRAEILDEGAGFEAATFDSVRNADRKPQARGSQVAERMTQPDPKAQQCAAAANTPVARSTA